MALDTYAGEEIDQLTADSELSVTVRVTPADVPPDADLLAESE